MCEHFITEFTVQSLLHVQHSYSYTHSCTIYCSLAIHVWGCFQLVQKLVDQGKSCLCFHDDIMDHYKCIDLLGYSNQLF